MIALQLTSCGGSERGAEDAVAASHSTTSSAEATANPSSTVDSGGATASICDGVRSLWGLADYGTGPTGAERAERLVEAASTTADIEFADAVTVFARWLHDAALSDAKSDLSRLMPIGLVERVGLINDTCRTAGRPIDLPEDEAALLFMCLGDPTCDILDAPFPTGDSSSPAQLGDVDSMPLEERLQNDKLHDRYFEELYAISRFMMDQNPVVVFREAEALCFSARDGEDPMSLIQFGEDWRRESGMEPHAIEAWTLAAIMAFDVLCPEYEVAAD